MENTKSLDHTFTCRSMIYSASCFKLIYKKSIYLQDRSECSIKGQWCQRASIAVNGMVRAASRSEKARFRIKMFLVL